MPRWDRIHKASILEHPGKARVAAGFAVFTSWDQALNSKKEVMFAIVEKILGQIRPTTKLKSRAAEI